MSMDDRHQENRLRALLSEAATTARPARPWADFVEDARRSFRLHRAVVVGVAACTVVLTLLVGRELTNLGPDGTGGVTQPAGNPIVTPSDPETTETDPSPLQPCDYPEERPTYLPWLDEGEEVGPPKKHQAESGDEGSDFASLLWPRDETNAHSDYVSLFVQSGEGGEGQGEVVDVEVNGEKGSFEIAPGDGDAAITWIAGTAPCNATVLTLRTSDWDDERLEHEIKKVARSLSDGSE